MIAKIDPRTTYLGVLDGGAFTYLVDGRVAMMGWMGRPHGEYPLTPSPAQFNRLAATGAGQAIPRSWLKLTWTNWNNTLGLDPMKVPRAVQGSTVYGAKTGSWMTLYMVQAAHEVRLRALINRVEPANARAVAARFVGSMKGPLSTAPGRCSAKETPLMASVLLDDAAYKRMDAYFKKLGMPATGCCGAPATWNLPGLSSSSVYVETRSFDERMELPNACVGVGSM